MSLKKFVQINQKTFEFNEKFKNIAEEILKNIRKIKKVQ